MSISFAKFLLANTFYKKLYEQMQHIASKSHQYKKDNCKYHNIMAFRNQFSYILLILLLVSCNTEDLMLKKLDIIPADKYYSTDIIPDSAQTVYGLWKFSSTSGGFSGRGFTIDFDYLILKPNAIFGLIKNDTLIAYGKLTLLKNTNDYFKHSLYCQFDFDLIANVQLAFDNEKFFLLETNDSLSLVAPCCDRYNMHFVRVNTDLHKSSKIGTLMGKISIGPLCPVETAPPQPGCLPTADTYKTWQLSVWNTT